MSAAQPVDADIAKAWPDRWAKANDPARRGRSKARNNLRKQWRYHVELAELRAYHPEARCGNCDNYRARHLSAGQFICLAESDFYGDLVVEESGLCTKWRTAR